MSVAYNEAPYLYQLYKYFNEMKILEWNEQMLFCTNK